jgi:hypothetical protein
MCYSATILLPCKACGAECHVIIKCDENPQKLNVVPVFCCKCASKIGQVPAISAWTHPAAREAMIVWMERHKSAVPDPSLPTR